MSADSEPVYEANQLLLERYGQPRLGREAWRDGRPGWNAGNYLAAAGHDTKDVLYGVFGALLTQTKLTYGEPGLYDNAEEFLIALHNKQKTAEVISSHPQAHLEQEIAAHGLAALLTVVYGDVAQKTERIRMSLDGAGLDAAQALYIGDTVQDMQAAHEAGVPPIAITHGYHSERILRAERPALVVASLGELATLVRES